MSDDAETPELSIDTTEYPAGTVCRNRNCDTQVIVIGAPTDKEIALPDICIDSGEPGGMRMTFFIPFRANSASLASTAAFHAKRAAGYEYRIECSVSPNFLKRKKLAYVAAGSVAAAALAGNILLAMLFKDSHWSSSQSYMWVHGILLTLIFSAPAIMLVVNRPPFFAVMVTGRDVYFDGLHPNVSAQLPMYRFTKWSRY